MKKKKLKKIKRRIPVAPPTIVFPDAKKYNRRKKKKDDYAIIHENLPQGTVVTFLDAPNWVM